MGERGLEHGGKRQIKVATSDLRMAVLVGDDLALFGELHLAVQYAAGLAENRGVRRTASTTNGSSPSVEDPDRDARLLGDLPDGTKGFVDLPLRGGYATVFVRVRVADHDLLTPATKFHDAAVGGHLEEGSQGGSDGPEVVNGFEQGNEPDAGHVVFQIDESDRAGQHHWGQHVLNPLGHRDDVALDNFVAVPVHDQAQCAK